jgi:hypothetical protein
MMFKKIAFLAIILGLSCNAFSAALYNQWATSPSSTDWNTAGNWALGYVPKITLGADNIRAGFKGAGAVWPIITSSTIPTPEAYNITLGGPTGGTLTINSGALNVGQYLFMGVSSNENGTLNVNGGTITTGTFTPSNAHFMVGQAGTGTVNMTGGTINLTAGTATGDLRIAYTATASASKLNLNGGVIYANNLVMNFASAGGLDIGGGMLILNDDQTTAIGNFVLSGVIVAYHGTGTVMKDYNITTPGKTTVWGYMANPKAANPNPGNGSSNLSISTTLNWTAGDGAASHNVYFGTASPGTSQGNQTATTFNPGTLAYGATYYWRIDEVSGANTVTGDVWNFSTTSGQATAPSPTNGAANVSTNPTLSWTAGQGITSHNVYFGTASPGTLQGTQSATTFNPGTLTPTITYYWRIDEVVGPNTVITGPIWSFTTSQLKATAPTPANSATNCSINPTLTWTAGAVAVSHDVYFGTASPGTSRGNQAGTSYSTGVLTPMTTYYWRIDEKDGSNNTTTGDVWSFTTGNPSPIYPYLTWKGSPTNSIVVNWWNPDGTGDSSVDYGLTDSYGSTVNVATVTDYHHVELTGLTPGATYHYKIRSNDGTIGSDNTFTTSDVNVTSFSFAVYGDPRGIQPPSDATPYHTRHKQLCDWLATQNIAFALETGDIVWAGALTDGNCLGFYKEYFKAEQNLSKTKPIMTTLGNHELQPNGLAESMYPYFNIYNTATYPNNGPAGVNARLYSFDYGNAHFVNATSFQVNMATETAWLDADLAAARANPNIRWVFVWMHEPIYTDSGHPGDPVELANWAPLFDKYHVDIVFSGHNHVYERFHSIKGGVVVPDGEGTVYITNGIGGAEFNTSTPEDKLVCWFGTTNLNKTAATIITINGNYLTSQTIPNLTGVPVDTFQLLPPALDGDFDESGRVDMKDLGIFSGNWLGTGLWP